MTDHYRGYVPRCWYMGPRPSDTPEWQCPNVGIFPLACGDHYHFLCLPHAYMFILKMCVLLRWARDSDDYE